jgi:hypothetical protein
MIFRFGHVLRHVSTSCTEDTGAVQSMAVHFVASRSEEKPFMELNGDGNKTCQVQV